MNNTFMKERPVFPLLMSMALPNVISMLVNSLYNIVDSLFVARINESAMTALSRKAKAATAPAVEGPSPGSFSSSAAVSGHLPPISLTMIRTALSRLRARE